MNEKKFLAEQFEQHRAHLQRVAFRMLGSLAEADDAVQDVWLRLDRAVHGDAEPITNLGGWLTTVTTRVCLDFLRARATRNENTAPAPTTATTTTRDPEAERVLADSVGLALLVVLDSLPPQQRVAFVLHDLFELSFDEIAPILATTEVAARQLASRARQKLSGKAALDENSSTLAQHRPVLDAFLVAARSGDLQGLIAQLDPNAVMREGATVQLAGARNVAGFYVGKAHAARPVLLDGALGLVVAPLGKLIAAVRLTFKDGKIASLERVVDPSTLTITVLEI